MSAHRSGAGLRRLSEAFDGDECKTMKSGKFILTTLSYGLYDVVCKDVTQ